MKKLILLVTIFLLSACTTVPVSQSMPVLPDELAKKCEPLTLLEGTTVTLSQLMTVVSKNYNSRHVCAVQLEAIQQWYDEQKKIFDKANK